MSYDHGLNCVTTIKEGVSKEQVAAALAPMMDYFNVEHLSESLDDSGYTRFCFDPETRELEIYTCGDVSSLYIDNIYAAAEALGPLVEQPGYFRLVDCDNPSPEDAVSEILFGGSPDEVNAFRKQMDVNAAMDILSNHLDDETLAAVRDAIESGGHTKADQFVSQVARLGIWNYDKNDGTPYTETEEPGDGHLDSHSALMGLIEEARRIMAGPGDVAANTETADRTPAQRSRP